MLNSTGVFNANSKDIITDGDELTSRKKWRTISSSPSKV